MKEIFLTQGKVALVDDCDFEWLSQHKWCVTKDEKTFYALRMTPYINDERHKIFMHHEVIGKPPKGFMADHKNGCGIDNRKENLRFVTPRQNNQNRQNIKKISKFPGVYWNKAIKKWHAQIRIKGISKHLGFFIDEEKAFKAYRKAVNEIGEEVVESDSYALH